MIETLGFMKQIYIIFLYDQTNWSLNHIQRCIISLSKGIIKIYQETL